MSDFEKKIIGNWENDEFLYNFKVNGVVIIHKIPLKTIEVRKWEIEQSDISFKDGSWPEPWGGRINYITDTEISITDKSDEVGKVNLLHRVYSDDIDSVLGFDTNEYFLENVPVEESKEKEKSFKEKAFDFAGSTLGIGFFVVLFGFIGYLGFQSFLQESFESKSLILGLPLLGVAIVIIVHLLLEDPYKDDMFKYIFYLLLGIFGGLPLLFVLLKLLFSILELWWLLLCVLMLIAIVMILKKEGLKWTHKVGTILLIIVALYFLFYASGIFKIKFDVYFNNKKIEFSGNNEEPRV